MLETQHLKETIHFYEKKLGYVCMSFDEVHGWASLAKDGTSIMFSLPHAHTPFDSPSFTGSLYFYTSEVDSLWDYLKDQVRICYDLEDFDYGMREFGIYDNNGYLLQFGQSLDTLVPT